MNSPWRSGTGGSERGRAMREAVTFTRVDVYRTVTSGLMVILGAVILARTLPLGMHLQALAMGLGFIGLGAYRLSFVAAHVVRRRRQA